MEDPGVPAESGHSDALWRMLPMYVYICTYVCTCYAVLHGYTPSPLKTRDEIAFFTFGAMRDGWVVPHNCTGIKLRINDTLPWLHQRCIGTPLP